MLTKREILSSITFGSRLGVAEDEATLKDYFVVTPEWTMLERGDIDIICGARGTGKSALTKLLLDRKAGFRHKGILIVPASNPDGSPIFGALASDPP